MLTVSNAAGGQMASYYQKDNYYLKGEFEKHNQEWHGKLQEHHKVSGEVEMKDFNRVYDFKEKRAAYDLTFSAPKSVSIAMTFPEHRSAILEAHMAGVNYALDQVEKNDIYYRVQENYEKVFHQSDNMIASKIMHEISRQLDPQLHTHALIKNETMCHDGKMRAISNEQIYRNYMLRGQQYKNMMIKNLMEKGYEIEITDQVKGLWELRGLSRDQIDVFSKRRNAIINEANRRGVDIHDPVAMQKVCLDIRKSISGIDVKGYQQDWEIEKELHGITADIYVKWAYSTVKQIDREVFFSSVNKAVGETKIGFTRNEYSLIALRLGMEYGILQKEVDLAFEKMVAEKSIVHTFKEGEKFYATVDSIDLEQSIYDRIDIGKGEYPGIPYENVREYLNVSKNTHGVSLTTDQEDGIIFFSTSNDRISGISGIAGSGKTTMLSELKDLYEKSGYHVRGISFTGIAIKELKQAGIDSETAHTFFAKTAQEAGLTIGNILDVSEYDFSTVQPTVNKEVWFVDEASQFNNLLMDKLIDLAERKNAKVHLLGDVKQYGGIGAGNSFQHMISEERIEHIFIKDNIRQKNAPKNIQLAIMENYNDNLPGAVKHVQGNIYQIQNDNKRRISIAKEYTGLPKAERDQTMIISGTNQDRIIINSKVREILKERKEIEKFFYTYTIKDNRGIEGDLELGVGDRVMFLRNDKKLQVNNGTVGEVIKLDENSITVDIDGRQLKINMDEYNRFQYAYATTSYKSMGKTADFDVIANYDTHRKSVNNIQRFTVDITRAKRNLKIYTNDAEVFYDAINRSGLQISSSQFVRDNLETFSDKIEKDRLGYIAEHKGKVKIVEITNHKNGTWDPDRDVRRLKQRESKLSHLSELKNGKNVIDQDSWNLVNEKSKAGTIMKFKNRDYPGVVLLSEKDYQSLLESGDITMSDKRNKFYGIPAKVEHDQIAGKLYIEFSKEGYKRHCEKGLDNMNSIVEKLTGMENLSRYHIEGLKLNKFQEEILMNHFFDNNIHGPSVKGLKGFKI